MGGSLTTYEPPPPIPEGVPLDVTGMLDILQQSTRAIEETSLLGRDAFQAHAFVNETTGDNPHRYGQWSFQYRVGMTQLVWVGHNTLSSSVVENIRFRAVTDPVGAPAGVVLLETALTSGLQTITVSNNLAARGWADGQIIEIHVELYDTGAPSPELGTGRAWGRYETVDFYVSPLSPILTDAWPGVPTFTTGPSAAQLEQLGNAIAWCAARIAVVPRPLFQSIAFATTLYHLDDYAGMAPINHQLWAGGFTRGQLDQLALTVRYDIVTNAAETLELLVNGNVGPSLGPLTAGNRGVWSPTVDLSGYGASTQTRLLLRSRTTAPGNPARPSRISVSKIELRRASPSPATLPAAPEPEELAGWATAKARLNSLASIVLAVRNRLNADGETWDKARLFRQNYGYDAGEKSYYETRHIPATWQRVGARLVVRGKNVTLGYGGAIFELVNAKEPDGTFALKNVYEEGLIPGDAYQSRVVYLDGLDGLETGYAYNVRGDVRYAAEYLL